jgi:DNA helicase-2/ATP-dependent DNA helicase PcrA
MSQFPIIIKPSLLEQALTATPKPEPYQPPVIPSPGAKPKRFKTGLLVAQAVVFTIIALVPAFFGEFILAAVLLAATVGVILAQVNNQRVEYPRKLRIWEEKVRGYEYELRVAEQKKKAHEERMKRLKTPAGMLEYRREQVKKALSNTRLPDGDNSDAPLGNAERFFLTVLERYFPGKVFTRRYINSPPPSDRYYTPDFTFIEPEYRLFMDIEIDEPYEYKQGKPTHFIGSDDERNRHISERYGWVVIRFTEEQVIRQPESCCKVIAGVLAEITLDATPLEPFAGVPDLLPEPQWTEGQANAKAIAKYRDTYQHLLPQPEKRKPKPQEPVKPKKEFQPSQYQLDIFDFIENGTGHGLVVAVAGSGKSTTLLQAARRIKTRSSIFLAFNNSIAKELSHKLKEAGATMEAKTINALGFEAVRAKIKKPDIKDFKYNYLLPNGYAPHDDYLPLMRLCRTTLVDVTDLAAVREMAEHYNLDVGYAEKMFPKLGEILEMGKQQALETGLIDFTDQLWLPLALALPMRKFDWIFVDECQDLSPLQLELVLNSLTPEGRVLFVGDPKQAIYGFAGADCRSVEKIKARTQATELPLSICYRCPTSHLNKAREIVPQIEARPGAPVGVIAEIPYDEVSDVVTEGDLIICRLTAPLVKLCTQLLVRRVKAHVKGEDIGQKLLAIVQKVAKRKGFSFRNFTDHLAQFAEEQAKEWSRRGETGGVVVNFQDSVAALKSAYRVSNSNTLEEYCAELEALFRESAEGGVTLCTVHKAKGLEAERVFILEPGKLPLVRHGQKDWELEQEIHLRYVALTRAKQELYFIQPV